MGAAISFAGKHVVITGGSEGIGLALADRFLADGATVSIVSRSQSKLDDARADLLAKYPDAQVHTESADVSDFSAIQAALLSLQALVGPIEVAVCNAGVAIPKKMADQQLAEAQQTMNVSYWGSYHVAKALLPSMTERGSAHLCFIASAAVLSPLVGFTSYAPPKAAVRALADALRSELVSTGVSVSVAYPPDTATPGFEKEEKVKPAETKALAKFFKDEVFTAERVAACLFRGLRRRAYHLPGPDALFNLGASVIAGLSPRPHWLIVEMLMAPLLVLIAVIYRSLQDRVIAKVRKEDTAGRGAT